MRTVLQIVLWIVCIVLGYLIYQSITGPIEFAKVKEERYAAVIAKLKDIRNAQEAHKTVTGRYADNFDNLISFIDTAEYTITQKRDSSYMKYNETYQIDMLEEVQIIDTLGFVSVKDSLFKNDDRFRNLAQVPYAQNNETFEMKADVIDKAGYKAPVFEVKVPKDAILYDQPKDLLARENTQVSVEEVNGPFIKVGSLSEVSTSGNWPPIYDKKRE